VIRANCVWGRKQRAVCVISKALVAAAERQSLLGKFLLRLKVPEQFHTRKSNRREWLKLIHFPVHVLCVWLRIIRLPRIRAKVDYSGLNDAQSLLHKMYKLNGYWGCCVSTYECLVTVPARQVYIHMCTFHVCWENKHFVLCTHQMLSVMYVFHFISCLELHETWIIYCETVCSVQDVSCC
jgi:hypothetical protein